MNHEPAVTLSKDPATGEVIGNSPLHSTDEVKEAVAASRTAQERWRTMPLRHRVAAMKRVRKILLERADELAEIIARDNGKTRIDALATEVLPAAMALSYYCRKAGAFLTVRKPWPSTLVLANKRSLELRVPWGVVAIISPWNYPFSIPFSEVVMALLAGNGVLLKTATETQQVGLALRALFDEAGLPGGLFHFVNLPGREAGQALLGAGVDKLFFTGSVRAGKELMALAAQTLTPVCLELGGNDAMIVCEDADLERAAAGAVWAGFQNAGQSCGGVERIYVHESVYDTFLSSLKRRTEALRVGRDVDFTTDMGVMTTLRQAELVESHVEDALKKGAKVYARSRCPSKEEMPHALPAMVLTDVTHEMDVMKDETFGPVLGVMKVRDMEEAVSLANDSYLGLTGSVWSKNRGKARKIARKIRAGVVTINDHLMSHGLAETSWGGFKESGIGRTHGKLGFDEMTQSMTIVDDWLSFTRKDLWWHPFSHGIYQGLKGILHLLYGPGLLKRISGGWAMMKILPRIFRTK
ncbi:MAG TPA: aldehyde dehydrogenase family protein [Thermoanaerobaculia bacterium]|nr:aldehyde dehydrogenase family protein [Thermoanaerobaculia bacterium]HUM29785.1 aldehyde dehydrogenase family protein [Thermoanaerobaculia bacterium]HXK68060.1 aldehyde dehydrogenase family protein [Thermoanaerobaculia bacterium]